MKKITLYFTLMTITVFGVASCSDDSAEMDVINAAQEIEISEKKSEDPTIAEIATAAGLTQLLGALTLVDENLDGTLEPNENPGLVNLFSNGKDQYTVFAPTNDAFDRLFITLADKGITVTSKLVYDVLLYHVTEGRRSANSVVPKNGEKEITTLLNATFDVHPDGMIEAVGNSAQIIISEGTYNISASNGIIHLIDEVILPINLPE